MKRKIALFLFVMMLCTVFIPLQSIAADNDGFQKALVAAKEKLSIPADYVFDSNFNVYTSDGKNIWSLNWHSKEEGKGSINVSLDESGTIYYYYNYKQDNYDYSKKRLPKVTADQAKAIAEAFIEKVNPDGLAHVKYAENQIPNSGTNYFFNYYRNENGIPYYDNGINVSVDSITGEVQNYSYNWTDGLVFPATDKVISMGDAQKIFKDKLGLKLVYKYAYDNNKLKIYPAYVPKYNSSYVIDAITGEKIQVGSNYYLYDSYGGAEAMKIAASQTNSANQVVISPEEEKAIDDISKIISRDEAKQIAMNLSYLKLDDTFKRVDINLYRDWLNKDTFYYDMYFNNGKDGKDNRSVNVRINAVTKEVCSFYVYSGYDPSYDTAEPKYDKAAAKSAVESFLKDFNAAKFNGVVYDDNNDNLVVTGTDKPKQFYFTYMRVENGIPFPDNYISASFDAVNGEILNYNSNWFDSASFPRVNINVSPEKSYQKLFNDVGFELQYKPIYSEDFYSKIIVVNPNAKPEIKLVYAVKPGKPTTFDPSSGDILDYSGKPYKEIKPVEYTDIKGNYAENQIKLLAQIGITLDGSEFKPNDKIVQKDFLTLLIKSMNYYYIPDTGNTDEYIDNVYKTLINAGIVKDGEKNPNAALTREDSIKFIIRALRYDKVADIKGIYKCDFKDAGKINPDLVGYVAIARGLEIVKGSNGYFLPKDQLTRAAAAIIIYNYLKV